MAADALIELRLRKLKILNDYYEEEQRRRAKLTERLAVIDQKMVLLVDSGNEIPCLVRITPGPKQTVYHSADATCDRVRDLRNYQRCSEYHALEEMGDWDYYLARCSACDWGKAAEVHAQRES
jgi:hypothetical protein